jgi:hypothetical protein
VVLKDNGTDPVSVDVFATMEPVPLFLFSKTKTTVDGSSDSQVNVAEEIVPRFTLEGTEI